jgi:O-antigen ligase
MTAQTQTTGAWPKLAAAADAGAQHLVRPNAFTRWAFYLTAFSIPFTSLYMPGTGERVGVLRLDQLLLLGAVVTQPRVCLRLAPVALVWFGAYYLLRICSGLWLAPEFSRIWWPTTLDLLQFSLPWAWIVFNWMQFPEMRRTGLWALGAGCSLCALLHILGIGVSAVDNSVEEVRTTVFGQNANIVGATYATALVALIGLGMLKELQTSRRWLLVPMIGLVGVALAKTGSRTALVMVVAGIAALLFQAKSFSSRIKRYTVLAVIAAVLGASMWQEPIIMARFRDLDPHNIGRLNPRARMAPVLWEMFLRSPIYGSGPDQYQFELTRRAMPYLIRDQKTIVAHNLVLLLLVETGIIGFLVFSAGMWKTLVAAWRARLKPCGYLPLALLLPFLIAGIVLANPVGDCVFWFVIAYALAGVA